MTSNSIDLKLQYSYFIKKLVFELKKYLESTTDISQVFVFFSFEFFFVNTMSMWITLRGLVTLKKKLEIREKLGLAGP